MTITCGCIHRRCTLIASWRHIKSQTSSLITVSMEALGPLARHSGVPEAFHRSVKGTEWAWTTLQSAVRLNYRVRAEPGLVCVKNPVGSTALHCAEEAKVETCGFRQGMQFILHKSMNILLQLAYRCSCHRLWRLFLYSCVHDNLFVV
jgi:hypothetical protein